MITVGAAAVPGTGAAPDQVPMPSAEELRRALRPPELPLPAPRTALDLAHRVSDLMHAERLRQAADLARDPADLPGTAGEEIVLLRVRLTALAAVAAPELPEVAAELATALRHQDRPEEAAAVIAVLLERGLLPEEGPRGSGASAGASVPGPSTGGRRRAAGPGYSPALLTVVRELDLPRRARPATTGRRGRRASSATLDPDAPRVRVRRLRTALEMLDEVRDRLALDPEPLLRLRLAQALEEAGLAEAAVTPALDALELLEDAAVEHGGSPDPHRVAIAARAVLARTLSAGHPALAVRHALDALLALRLIDDPPLRIGLITDLLDAQVAAGMSEHAAFTAGRLASLQRTLPRDDLRIAPLLAVATQRVRSGRDEAAQVPLAEVRVLARDLRDRRASMEAARLAAILAERAGDLPASLLQLRRTAADAHWLADDLATPAPERGPLLRTELEALALVMRRAMDLGETGSARAAARAIERRTRPDGGRLLLPAPLLWDHRVDARVGELLAVGDALARQVAQEAAAASPATGPGPAGGPSGVAARAAEAGDELGEDEYARLLDAARAVIDQAPGGHEERARYWEAYLLERHAAALAARGRRTKARRAARRAVEAWRAQDAGEDLARAQGLLAELEGARGAGATGHPLP